MRRIEIGQHIRVNYTPGTSRVEKIFRNCTCTHVLDSMNERPHMGEYAKPLPPHMHIVERHTEDGPKHLIGEIGYVGYIDEATLRMYNAGGVLGRDRIILVENPVPVQISLAI